jgi:hypothetical protein
MGKMAKPSFFSIPDSGVKDSFQPLWRSRVRKVRAENGPSNPLVTELKQAPEATAADSRGTEKIGTVALPSCGGAKGNPAERSARSEGGN